MFIKVTIIIINQHEKIDSLGAILLRTTSIYQKVEIVSIDSFGEYKDQIF